MADAEAGDRVHHETGVAGKCPSQSVRGAHDIRQVIGPPGWADLTAARARSPRLPALSRVAMR
jgi:hypothetical protein